MSVYFIKVTPKCKYLRVFIPVVKSVYLTSEPMYSFVGSERHLWQIKTPYFWKACLSIRTGLLYLYLYVSHVHGVLVWWKVEVSRLLIRHFLHPHIRYSLSGCIT